MFNIAKNLIKIEQKWLNNIKKDYRETKQTPPYNQLDIDSLVNQINQDINKQILFKIIYFKLKMI